MLRVEALTKRYPTGDMALNGVSLAIGRGEIAGLIGSSGAGKSTLIRCINRLVEPTSGRVFLDGVDLTALGPRALRRARVRIGMIFQEFALVERLTVMENVLAGRLGATGFWASWFRRFPPQEIARALDLLERVGLSDQIDKRADALSGGQRQRVGIARALAQEPDLLLVDEPTASLDPRNARDIMELLTEICRERRLAAIVNIHDVGLARRFLPRIVGLRAGEIAHDGPPSDLTPETLTMIYGGTHWDEPPERQARPLAMPVSPRDLAETAV
jgi:phosphonate transport system ATP-binding protein